ncbi:MAG: nucleoside triphosphate pyrophosphatase [Acidobacteriota bacterium]
MDAGARKRSGRRAGSGSPAFQRLVLASRSPRRRFLLRLLDVPFTVRPSGIPEHRHPGETPRQRAMRLARRKAEVVARRHPSAWVLGCDTIVSHGTRQLGIPRDRSEAEAMLRLLSGRVHQVWTGVALAGPLPRTRVLAECTRVRIAPLTEAELQAYLDSGEWKGKAGAYAIQGRFAAYVRHLEGSYTNVVGLPLEPVRRLLRAAGIRNPARGGAVQAPRRRQRSRGWRAAATSSSRRTGVR